VAVEAFLGGQIGFPAIHEVVSETLASVPGREPRSIGEILEIDRESREAARALTAAIAARAGAVTA